MKKTVSLLLAARAQRNQQRLRQQQRRLPRRQPRLQKRKVRRKPKALPKLGLRKLPRLQRAFLSVSAL